MEFTPENWAEMTRNIIAASSDQGELTATVTKASESVSELFKEYTSTKENAEKLQVENERLKKYNMDLFERVTSQEFPKEDKQDTKSKAETITTADLFKEEK